MLFFLLLKTKKNKFFHPLSLVPNEPLLALRDHLHTLRLRVQHVAVHLPPRSIANLVTQNTRVGGGGAQAHTPACGEQE